jgi:hypothetical protein
MKPQRKPRTFSRPAFHLYISLMQQHDLPAKTKSKTYTVFLSAEKENKDFYCRCYWQFSGFHGCNGRSCKKFCDLLVITPTAAAL